MRASVGLLLAIIRRCRPFSQDPRAFTNKLAPYVASPTRVVDLMLEMAKIKPGETVYDLGSGDGRIVIAAAEKYKAKAVGIEISPKLVASATAEIERAGLSAASPGDSRRRFADRFYRRRRGHHVSGDEVERRASAAPGKVPEARRARGFSRLPGSRLEAYARGEGGRARDAHHLSLRDPAAKIRRRSNVSSLRSQLLARSIWPG